MNGGNTTAGICCGPAICRRRSGFTLIEVVLALGLCIVLLAALYASMRLQAKYNAVSTAEIREPLVARAVLHRIAADVRQLGSASPPSTVLTTLSDVRLSKLLTISAAEESDKHDTTGSKLADRTDPDFDAGFTSLQMPPRGRLIGTRTALRLSAPVPLSETKTDPPSEHPAPFDVLYARHGAAFVRHVQGRNYARTKVLAREIAAWTFQYHDGKHWVGQWRTENALPRAVEITISFDAPDVETQADAPNSTGSHAEPIGGDHLDANVDQAGADADSAVRNRVDQRNVFRLVVALP